MRRVFLFALYSVKFADNSCVKLDKLYHNEKNIDEKIMVYSDKKALEKSDEIL